MFVVEHRFTGLKRRTYAAVTENGEADATGDVETGCGSCAKGSLSVFYLPVYGAVRVFNCCALNAAYPPWSLSK